MDEAQVWSRADRSRVGGRVADEEECSKRLILGSGFKTADLAMRIHSIVSKTNC